MKALSLAVAFWFGLATPVLCAGYDELNIGIALFNRGELDGAIAHFSAALAANDLTIDQQYVAHYDRGTSYGRKGRLDDALADLTISIALKPGDRAALLNRLSLYMLAGKPEAALKDADAMIAANPDAAGPYINRARAYEVMGEADKELQELQTALAKSPNKGPINFNIAFAYLQLGETAEAAEMFKAALDVNPGYSWLGLAMAELKEGRAAPSDVESHLKQANWPNAIIDFYRGRTTEAQVMAAAAGSDLRVRMGQVCEANFYIGEWHLLHGDKTGAKPLIQAAASGCPFGFVEWYASRAELKNAS